MSTTPTPWGNEIDPTHGKPFNPLEAFMPKGQPLPDDGSSAHVTTVLAQIDALVAQANMQHQQAAQIYEQVYIPNAANQNAILTMTEPLLKAFYDTEAVAGFLMTYRTTVINWQTAHNSARAIGAAGPTFPQPDPKLLVYMPALSF